VYFDDLRDFVAACEKDAQQKQADGCAAQHGVASLGFSYWGEARGKRIRRRRQKRTGLPQQSTGRLDVLRLPARLINPGRLVPNWKRIVSPVRMTMYSGAPPQAERPAMTKGELPSSKQGDSR
jgi:hypothetical protein